MTVLQTMWGKAVVVRIRARRVFVLGTVLANLSLVALPRAHGLDPDRRISQYGHTVWRIQDGAIPPPTSIAQTADGFLWITTAQGLMRFDGVRFVPWQPPQGQNLPGTHFSAIFGSRDGSLWIGTTRGLARWKDGQLRTYTDLEHPAGIFEIMEDDSGTIWATRYGQYAREAPLCSISEETLRCFGKKDGIPVGYGLGLTHDSEGNIWFGSSVLVRWRPGAPATTYFGEIAELAKSDGVVEVALGPSGTAWASLDGTGPQLGIRHYSGGKWTSYAVPGFDRARVRPGYLLIDRRGSLWVSTKNDGVYRICGGVADHYGVSDGLSGNDVGPIFEDREGNIWVLTDGGLDMFRDTALISYTTRQGVSDSEFHSVMALRNGALLIGTSGALNILRKQDGKTAISDRKVSGQGVGPMLEDHSGMVWLGVDLALMRFQNGRFREIRPPGGPSFASFGGVTGIAEDSGGTIWVLTPRGQLFSIVGDKIKQASPNYELGPQRYLVADPNGGLWLGAPSGTISYFRDGRLQTTSLSSPQGPVSIRAPFVDSDNSLLVPSSQGLYRLNHGQVTLFSSDNGLPCPEIFNAIRDNHGALWIYTRCGMVRIGESEWAKWIENPHVAVSVMILDALDGAQAGTGDSYQPRSSKAPDGRLWFETGVSIQVLDPDRLYENPLPPPVYVGGVVADRKRFDATSLVKVPALSRDLEIDYTAPSFSVPQKVRFRYMLEGRDREWQDAGTRRQAFYTDLKPGHYRFRVTACNSQGVWNQTGASLEFSIAPAYWQTNWFRAACVAAFMVLLWMLYRMRLRRLAREFTAGLEARVNERTRIARELHDSLLQGFQGLMFRLQAVRDLLPGRASEAMQALDIALERGDKAIAEGRDTVSDLREPIMGDSDIAQALTALGEELALQSGNGSVPRVRVLLEGKQRELNPILRDEVYRIAREALRNAFRHARAQKIEAEITYSDSEFLLHVRDDGGGIDPEVANQGARAGHWGLPGMRERAKRFGGRLEVWSEQGAGTEIELSVPGTIAYGKSEPRRRFWLWRKKIGESDGQQS
jgi:signal transduction histidine kinase/ligand-binding sensor domain-containing protein